MSRHESLDYLGRYCSSECSTSLPPFTYRRKPQGEKYFQGPLSGIISDFGIARQIALVFKKAEANVAAPTVERHHLCQTGGLQK